MPTISKREVRGARKIGLAHFKLLPKARSLILQTLKRGRVSPGPLTEKFEQSFSKMHGRKFGMFTNSGTSALQVALHALKSIHDWKDGDEVLVPAVTFVATSNIVILNGLKPVFVDVQPETYNIDTTKIEAKISKKTRAIIPVHLFGMAADMQEIQKIAARHKLKIIEDSCEAMSINYHGKPVGSWGDIACFSTYMAHLLVTGVGGLAITNNAEYAVKMKSLMNHGRDSIYLRIDDDDNKKGGALFNLVQRRFSFVDVGYSYRATEMEAALGIAGLDTLKKEIAMRQKNAVYLIKRMQKLAPFLRLPVVLKDREHAFMMFPITIIDKRVKRDDLVFFLEQNGIETRYNMPLLSQPIYKKLFGNIEKGYPVAQDINRNGFYISCHHGLTGADLNYIVDIFVKFFDSKKNL